MTEKKRFTLWYYYQFKKNCQTKTRPVVRRYIYWLESMYIKSDEKYKLLLHCYIRIKK